MLGDRGAMRPSEVSLREGRALSLGMLPSKEKRENMDLMRDTREGPVWIEVVAEGEVGSALKMRLGQQTQEHTQQI